MKIGKITNRWSRGEMRQQNQHRSLETRIALCNCRMLLQRMTLLQWVLYLDMNLLEEWKWNLAVISVLSHMLPVLWNSPKIISGQLITLKCLLLFCSLNWKPVMSSVSLCFFQTTYPWPVSQSVISVKLYSVKLSKKRNSFKHFYINNVFILSVRAELFLFFFCCSRISFAEVIIPMAVKWPNAGILDVSVDFLLFLLFLWSSGCCYVFFLFVFARTWLAGSTGSWF